MEAPRSISTDPRGLKDIERRFLEVVRPLDLLKKKGLRPLEPLQDLEQGEISPENFIGTDLRALEKVDCPNILIMMPHSGEYAPKNLYNRLTEEGKKFAAKVDAGTVAIGRSEKILSMWPKIARLCGFDLNRRPFGKDAILGAPGSFVWRETGDGSPVYRQREEPTSEEMAYLSGEYHDRYYTKILDLLDKLSARNNMQKQRVLAIDLHSFSDTKSKNKDISELWKRFMTPEKMSELQKENPLFILSDRSGLSCDADIKDALMRALESNFVNSLTQEERSLLSANTQPQEIVSVEKYFPTGGYNTEFASEQRKQGRLHMNLIQVEMNEAAYVDFVDGYDDAQYDHKKLEIMKKLLQKSLLDVNMVI